MEFCLITKCQNQLMKTLFSTSFLLLTVLCGAKAQATLDQNIHFFSVSNFTSGKFDNINNNAYPNNKGGGFLLPGRWDWIMPHSGRYAYVDGSALVGGFMANIPSGGFLEGGYGWMFNNKSVRQALGFVKVQYGLGLGFGFRKAQSITNTSAGALYGALWPEVASITSIGENLEVVPRFILHPMINNGYMGMRTEFNVMAIYKLAKFLGVSAKYGTETHSYKDGLTTSNGVNMRGKASFSTLQLGVTIHN